LLSSSGKTLDELRQERLARESSEQKRSEGLGRVIAPVKVPVSKYNSGYFKAESRTNHMYRQHQQTDEG